MWGNSRSDGWWSSGTGWQGGWHSQGSSSSRWQQQQQQAPLTREQKKAKDNKRKKAGGAGQERATTRLNLKGALMASQAALAAALAQVKDLQAGHSSSAQTAEKQQLCKLHLAGHPHQSDAAGSGKRY